ncbi:glutaredoxin-like protein C5orf63 homolog isoform X2 [Ranitomeya variabilis]|uniref:glutaredoxin-like protein C5orf63 homolog isoform X2 n=1 Tax=Ranitomeya variabilis TaxID=490064 RepID=UPI004056D5F8
MSWVKANSMEELKKQLVQANLQQQWQEQHIQQMELLAKAIRGWATTSTPNPGDDSHVRKTMFHLRHVHRMKHLAFQSTKRHYAQEKPVLTLFTKFVLEQVDITLPENTAWYDRYKHDIPVFHLNGQFLMMHRVNIKKLERYLCKLEQDDDIK